MKLYEIIDTSKAYDAETLENLEYVGEVVTTHGLTLEEVIDLLGGEIVNDENDDRFSNDGDNVIINGVRRWYENLVEIW